MTKIIFVLALTTLLQAQAYAQFATFNIAAGNLRDDAGILMPNASGLIVLVVDTLQNGFSTPSTSASLGTPVATFLNDDLLLGKWQINGGAGVLSDTTGSLALSGDWGGTDPVKMYWFPALSLSSSSIPSGTKYGEYTDATGIDGSDPWETPGTGLVTLNFLTTGQTGSNPESAGNASLTVVPEPSTYAAVFGLLSLAGAALTKKLRKANAL